MSTTRTSTDDGSDRPDTLTVAAFAILAYALASAVHEGLGHGAACVLTGGGPRLITSMQFDCDERGLTRASVRLVAAAGSLVQLAVGIAAFACYRRACDRISTTGHQSGGGWAFALWLAASVNLLQAIGYLFYSGVSGIGDWAEVVDGLQRVVLWRVSLGVFGFAAYWLTTVWLFRRLTPYLPPLSAGRSARVARARLLGIVPYLTGGALAIAAGLRNPAGVVLLAISGAAASLGGTSGLVWGPETVGGERKSNNSDSAPATAAVTVRRSGRVILLGVAVAALFVALLGPGVRFR